jgi:hypothetical protein
MRSSKSRSRSKSNRNRNNNNSLGNVVNRVFDSSGPEGKVRGTPQQIIEKYNQLARDASLANDRVAAENFQQHAEHYLRLLGEAQREQDQRREQMERENRERQAQRDRERGDGQGHAQGQGGAGLAQPDFAPEAMRPAMIDPGSQDQPDVLSFDRGSDDDGPGLVETPESRSSLAARPVDPQEPAAAAAAAAPAAAADASSASEPAAEAKPKKPRAPRKPRKKPEGKADDTASAAPSQDAAE